MILMDGVKANWAQYILKLMLDHVLKNSTVKSKHKFPSKVNFGLKVSLICEHTMKNDKRVLDRGELFSESDFIPSIKKKKDPLTTKRPTKANRR